MNDDVPMYNTAHQHQTQQQQRQQQQSKVDGQHSIVLYVVVYIFTCCTLFTMCLERASAIFSQRVTMTLPTPTLQ